MSTYFDADRRPFDGRSLTPPLTGRYPRRPDAGHGAECRPSNPEIGCVCGEDERQALYDEAHPRAMELQPGQRIVMYGKAVTVLSVVDEPNDSPRPWVRLTYESGTYADGGAIEWVKCLPAYQRMALAEAS